MALRSLFPAARFANRIEQLFYRNLFVMVKIAIPCRFARPARTIAFINVGVSFRVFVAAFAMCLRSLISCVCANCWHRVTTRIETLFFSSRPSTIRWFIVSVVIYAINRVSKWTRPHVGNEILESASAWLNDAPSIANSYSASSPIFVIMAARIRAALDHGGPSPIKRLQRFVAHLSSPFKCAYCNTLKAGYANAF